MSSLVDSFILLLLQAQNSRLNRRETQKYHQYFLYCTTVTLCEYILFVTVVAFTTLSLLNQFG